MAKRLLNETAALNTGFEEKINNNGHPESHKKGDVPFPFVFRYTPSRWQRIRVSDYSLLNKSFFSEHRCLHAALQQLRAYSNGLPLKVILHNVSQIVWRF